MYMDDVGGVWASSAWPPLAALGTEMLLGAQGIFPARPTCIKVLVQTLATSPVHLNTLR